MALLIAAVAVVALWGPSGADPSGADPSRVERSGSEHSGADREGAGSSAAEPTPDGTYVHLGDSYAAGTGAGEPVSGSSAVCMRTDQNFGEQLARRRGQPVLDVSCAGATTANLTADQYYGVGPQLDALSASTRVVTVMIGGNDADVFATLIGRCASLAESDPAGAPCRTAVGDRIERDLREQVGPALMRAFADIAAAAPNARVVVPGYPWVVPATGSCRPAVQLADGDVRFVREFQTRLNGLVAAAAEASGAVFVDLAERSDGHDACAPPGVRWIEPMRDPATGSRTGVGAMHPNERGQTALADAVATALVR